MMKKVGGGVQRHVSKSDNSSLSCQFEEQVRKVDFLERVFYYAPNPAAKFTGGSRFVKDWPMKEMLIRSMKNER
jgi:hypothetical protein